jgi:hypothetical protein
MKQMLDLIHPWLRPGRSGGGADSGKRQAGVVDPGHYHGARRLQPRGSGAAMAEISLYFADGAIALVIADGAGWHSSPKLTIPENIALLKLAHMRQN